jgi:hypothetical protein
VLAAKCALAIRVDALGDSTDATVGLEAREKVEARLRQLEGRAAAGESGRARGKGDTPKYDKARQVGGWGVFVRLVRGPVACPLPLWLWRPRVSCWERPRGRGPAACRAGAPARRPAPR